MLSADGTLDLGCESELDGSEMAEANANGEGNGGKCGRFWVKSCSLKGYVEFNNLLIEFPTIIDGFKFIPFIIKQF